ncbi:MAG TPA: PAS domain S-box protein [Trichocoleus sp.]|jgi:PAS domain S-box-containing protein
MIENQETEWLRQRNAELEALVQDLRSQLQTQTTLATDIGSASSDLERDLVVGQDTAPTSKLIPHASDAADGFEQVVSELQQINDELLQAIEELQVAEEELRRQNAELITTRRQVEFQKFRYKELFEFAPDGYVVTDEKGIIQEANQAAALLLGIRQPRLVGKPLGVFVSPGDRKLFRAQLNYLAALPPSASGIIHHPIALTLNPRLGQPFAAAMRIAPVYEGQQLISFRWLIQDISLFQVVTEAVRRNEQKFRSIFEWAAIGIALTDFDAKVLEHNRSLERMLGYSAAELQHLSFAAFTHPDDLTLDADRRQELAEGKINSYEIEKRFIRKSGTWFWGRLTVSLVRDEKQSQFCFDMLEDITERKQLENYLCQTKIELGSRIEVQTAALQTTIEQLEQTQEAWQDTLHRLDFHIENSPLGIIEWDQKFQITRWSKGAESIFGWSAAEMLGQTAETWNHIIPADQRIVEQAIAQLLNGEVTRNVCRNRNYTKAGSIIDCVWHNSSLFNSAGEMDSLLSLVEDVTDQKQAEQELRDSEERFRQLADNIPQVFWIASLDTGKTLYISPTCTKIWGYSPERFYEEPGDFWLTRVHPDDLPQIYTLLEQQQQGQMTHAQYRILQPDGSLRWMSDRAFPFFDENGRLYRVAGITEDVTDRKHQEERLRLLEMVVVNSNDAVLITTADLDDPKIVYVNHAFTQITGYSSEEVLGKTPRLLQGANTDRATTQKIRESLSRYESIVVEILNYNKEGLEAWIDLSIFPVLDQFGQYTHFVAFQRDITQRKQTEAALMLQHQRSELFAEIALKIRQSLQLEDILQTTVNEVREMLQCDRVLIYRILPDGSGLVATEAAESCDISILGQFYPLDAFPLEYHLPYCHGKVRAIEDVERDGLAPRCSRFLREIGVRAKLVVPIVLQESLWGLIIAHQCDGPRQWSEFEIELLQQIAHQLEIALAQSQLLQAVSESEERFRTMANSTSVLIWISNPQHECVFCNQTLLDFVGRTLDQQLGYGWTENLHPDDRQFCLEEYLRAQAEQQAFEVEYRMRRADGEYRWMLDQAAPCLMPNGQLNGYIGSCVDITDRKQAEVEVYRALKKEKELSELKSHFVSNTSHEFRTPLSTILSSADLIEFYLEQGTVDRIPEHIRRIQTTAVSMTNLLNDILILEKAEVNKLPFVPAPIDLEEFCAELVEEMRLNDHNSHLLTLDIQHEDNPNSGREAQMDERLLRQIFSNLLGNALKYSPTDTTVRFSLVCHNNNAHFAVQDQGIGIPPKDQARLFEPFHRASNVGAISGSGLGLAIVKRSIDIHGGSIAVMSHPETGTTVQVTLPLQPVVAEMAAEL